MYLLYFYIRVVYRNLKLISMERKSQIRAMLSKVNILMILLKLLYYKYFIYPQIILYYKYYITSILFTSILQTIVSIKKRCV